ncbi:hypothetical protein UlMin_025682 [Ulmus minor]
MKSLSSVGIGLSVIFSCLFFALVAELYYLFWWKKRFINREIENDYSSPAKELFYMFCWRKDASFTHSALNPQELRNTTLSQEPNSDFLFKPFGEEGSEADFLRLQNPPRFLFTIVEETKEDLESEDGKSRVENRSTKGSRSRSLSDLLITVETPYMTPSASPPFYTPPLTPSDSLTQNGFNYLFESAADAEFNRIRSSPPPKFKFLQEAEEKLKKKNRSMEKSEIKELQKGNNDPNEASTISSFLEEEEEESFITINVDRTKLPLQSQFSSSTSQVLPLASSPSTFRSPITKK